jgi:site-specific recombinase XerD
MRKMTGLPRFVTVFFDRHGKRRYRARRHGLTYYFTSAPGTDEFLIEYQRWLAGKTEIGSDRTVSGSVSALIAKYYRSAEWANLSAATQSTYRGILERFRADHGDKPVNRLERHNVRDIVAARANTPAAANNMLRMIRLLMRFAIDEEWRKDDPTLGIKTMRIKSDGFHCWTEEEITTFESRWAIGTSERLALALLLYTGQRRGDVIHMGRQHISKGVIQLVQHKTKARLVIPVHPELQRAMDGTNLGNLTLLCSSHDRPFTAAGFGNWFREACHTANVRGCSAHGLRKAAARRLAEAGCSPHQIASVTGHKTLKEVERYTKAANQERLAQDAMRSIGANK